MFTVYGGLSTVEDTLSTDTSYPSSVQNMYQIYPKHNDYHFYVCISNAVYYENDENDEKNTKAEIRKALLLGTTI